MKVRFIDTTFNSAVFISLSVFCLVSLFSWASSILSPSSIPLFALRPQVGIIVSALVFHERRYALPIIVAGYLGLLIPGTADSVIPGFILAGLTIIEAILFSFTITLVCKKIEMDKIAHILYMLVIATLTTSLVACVTTLFLTMISKIPFMPFAQLWAMSDALWIVLCVPLVSSLFDLFHKRKTMKLPKLGAGIFLCLAAIGLGSLWFFNFPLEVVIIFFILTSPIPFLIWAGSRFGVFGTSLASLFIFSGAVIGSALGTGVFASFARNPQERMVLAFAFSMWFSLLPLFNAASIERKRGVEGELKATNAELEEAIENAERARALAERALETKDLFLSNMSHEIRTPLNGMLGMASLLAKSELNDEQSLYADNMKTSGKLLLRIVNDILDIEKIEYEAWKPRLEETDVEALCRAVLGNFKSLAAEKGLGLESFFSGLSINYLTDPQMLSQILSNLCGNAIKFTKSGRIGFEASSTLERGNAAMLTFRVSDTGIGIPAAEFDTIFERFHQIDSSYSKRHEGTGLGLHIAKRLAELLGGTIKVESELGKGSIFTVRIACSIGMAESAKVNDRSENMKESVEEKEGRLVLVAEDNAINLLFIQSVLKDAGYRVHSAADGVEALAKIEKESPDIILMDIQMPEMDGIECAKRIRSNPDPKISSLPIIAVTGYARTDDRNKCLDAGMNGFLSKPFDGDDLISLIEKEV